MNNNFQKNNSTISQNEITDRLLNVNITLNNSQNTSKLIDYIADDINLTTKKNKIHIGMVIANLLKNYNSQNCWTSYSRDNNFSPPKRYNPHSITSYMLILVIDRLFVKGYIDKCYHIFKRIGHKDNKISSMRADPTLISIINELKQPIDTLTVEEVLILRDNKKEDIDYFDDDKTKSMRKLIIKYNQFIKKVPITFNPSKVAIPANIDFDNKRVRRIFNNSSFNEGGRFYGGFWQSSPRKLRKHLQINHSPTVELDFQAFYVRLLYAKEKALFPRNIDPYLLPSFANSPNHKAMRSFCKKVLLTSFNVSSTKSLAGAIGKELVENPEPYPPLGERPKIPEVVKLFKEFHPPLAKYICTNYGASIQYLESRIAEYIIKKMTSLNYPVLTIHDSFICMEEHEQTLETIMKEGFLYIFKNFPQVEHPVITRVGAFRSITCELSTDIREF